MPLMAIAPGGGTPGPVGAQDAIAGVAPLAYALSAQVQRLAGLCHASKRTPPSRAAHHPKWMIYGASSGVGDTEEAHLAGG